MWHLGVVLFDGEFYEVAEPLYRVEGVEVKPLVFQRLSEKATMEIRDAEACPAGPSAKSALSLWERERVREISPSPRAPLPVGEGKSPGYDSTSPFQTRSRRVQVDQTEHELFPPVGY